MLLPKNDKLNRKKLYDEIDSIKGLGIQICINVTCKQRLNHVAIRLNQAKVMVIELRYVAGGQFSPGTGAGIRTIAPEENCPRLGLGFRSRLGLVLGLGDNHKIAPEKN